MDVRVTVDDHTRFTSLVPPYQGMQVFEANKPIVADLRATGVSAESSPDVAVLIEQGFTPVIPPVLVREEAMYGTGFFPTERSNIYALEADADPREAASVARKGVAQGRGGGERGADVQVHLARHCGPPPGFETSPTGESTQTGAVPCAAHGRVCDPARRWYRDPGLNGFFPIDEDTP